MQLKPDAILQKGKYRIIRLLGQGGFGITYLAENTFLDKKVAVKEFFPKEFCGRDATSHLTLGTENNAETVSRLRERFIKEARNIARLDYPGIVKIHDVFEENGTAYYVMDYIEGESLSEMVKRHGPLPEGNAIDYVRRVGHALEYIHSRNMTHFDVKPANIVVRKSDDMPVLIDFGLSKQYDTHGDATSTLMQALSHGYAPMEMYSSQGIISFSPQTDVYSLAATLLYLLTAKQPPQASLLIEDGLHLPEWLDTATKTAIRQGMEPSRKHRFATVQDFVQSLPDIAPVDLGTDDTTELLGGSGDTAESERLRQRVAELDEALKSKTAELSQARADRGEMEAKMAQLTKEASARKPGKKWLLAFCAAAFALLVSLWVNMMKTDENHNLEYSRGRYMAQAEELEKTLDRRNELIRRISNGADVFISDVEVRNEGQDYGDKIYSGETTFINPRFKALNMSDSDKEIGIKFYGPQGLSTGPDSSRGFSYVDMLPGGFGYTYSLDQWVEPQGWGGKDKGNWEAGNYRLELWVDGKCAATKSFTIYK